MDGELAPDLEGPLRAHLETCADCRAIAEEYTRLDKALRGLILDPGAASRVATRALVTPALGVVPRSAPPTRRSSKVLAALAATLSMAAAILALIWFSGPV